MADPTARDEMETASAGSESAGPATTGALAALLRQLVSELGGHDESDALPEISSDALAAAGFKYELGPRLGAGGGGVVYRAYDAALSRPVALKFLRHQSASTVERFLREARAQARIEHDHVCRVYEIGEVAGISYIALQYIEGETLQVTYTSMSFEEKAKLIEEVAEALHAAHRLGLIHRDVKPSNIMVERGEDGRWKPYVLDFGLAREAHGPGMTLTGQILGTPYYMSPEQARGDLSRIDRRTDVYSLGATLYHLLAEEPPFQGENTAAVLTKLIATDPEPVRKRRSSIPIDLESITMKCLEKNPQDRYDSARALAEDLRRYLDGEPVRARRAGLLYGAWKMVRRHPLPSALSLFAVAGILLAAFVALQARAQAAARAASAQRFGQQVREIENVMRTAYLFPLHDVSAEKDRVRRRMRSMEAEIESLGSAAEGPGDYALGAGHLALEEPEEARPYLERAWQRMYRAPEVALALGQTLGSLYQRGLEEAERIRVKSDRETQRKKLMSTLRDPALSYLRAAQGAWGETAAYIDALIAFYEGEQELALAKAREAASLGAGKYEARRIEALVHLERGDGARDRGDYAAAAQEYDRAGAALTAALDIARSRSSLYEADCRRWLHVAQLERARAGSMGGALDSLRVQCGRAVVADPTRYAPLVVLSAGYTEWAEDELDKDRDVRLATRVALDATRDALRRWPRISELHTNEGVAHGLLARYALKHGEDPRSELQLVLDCNARASALKPQHPVPYINSAYTYGSLAEYDLMRGADPRPNLRRAVAASEEALRVKPGVALVWNNLGNAYGFAGTYESRHGIDPMDTLAKAIDAYQRAIAINPRFTWPVGNVGVAYAEMAYWKVSIGQDPSGEVQKAAEAVDLRLRLDPKGSVPHQTLGIALLAQAELERRSGRDPTATLDRAVAALKKCSPTFSEGRSELGDVYLDHAHVAAARGADPRPYLTLATEEYRKALASNPRNGQALVGVARVAARTAAWEERMRRSPRASLDEADRAARRAYDLVPKDPEAPFVQAEVHLERARSLRAPAERAREIALGLAKTRETLSLHPRHGEAMAVRALLMRMSAQAERNAELRKKIEGQVAGAWKEAFLCNPLLRREYERYLP
jgi:serine/threonine-protein kinase